MYMGVCGCVCVYVYVCVCGGIYYIYNAAVIYFILIYINTFSSTMLNTFDTFDTMTHTTAHVVRAVQ